MNGDPLRSAEAFFDHMGDDYDDAIDRCVPRYREMLGAVIGYVPARARPRRVLELGCGSGNLTALARRAWPEADVIALDISQTILGGAGRRFRGDPRMRPVRADMRRPPFAAETFDVVISSIALHHLPDAGKREVFSAVFDLLVPGGILAYSDQFAGETSDLYARHMSLWRERARELGSDDALWDLWMEHQDVHDFHAPLRSQLRWLEAAGFEVVDCVWRYALWTVIQARKAQR